MTKDQEIKKSGSESTMVEDTTQLYVTMSQDENRRIVVHSHISMPFSGMANASWFDGRDAILFIERFYQMCKNYEVIDPKNIIKQLARYCVTWIGEWMKTLEDYKKGNWEVFSKEIIYKFCDQNITYKIYYQNYLQELSEKLQNKIIDKIKLNLSDNMSPINFRKVYEENKKIFKEDEMKQKKIEKLVKALKKTASSVKTEESESKSKAKSSESTNIEAVIEKMTNEFINLALAMRVQLNQIQGNSDQYYMLQREEPLKPILNYTTNVTTNSATVQENIQLQLVNSYVAQNSSLMTSYCSSS
ncbi:uncharacterized protein CIMG_12615 [Coccidioides immitis RS]|uniref:Uncharacterized protein n=1 Tax=Coccidioides immitis (strain RS) TaxID=246410 RepID=J3KMC0_COCIM|nr:uncharacterized protein CIMG_12615 [Coccidioides immitis RS]EAS37540.3 hypothetical protein CIMG_12615 [Coccidioides immitis RS]